MDGGMQHAGHGKVSPVYELPIHFVDSVHARHRLPHEAPLRRILERHRCRRLELRGRAGQRSVAQGSSARTVRNNTVARRAVFGTHAPLGRRRGDKQFARQRTAFAHVLVAAPNAATAPGTEAPPDLIAAEALSWAGKFPRNVSPVALELFSDQLHKASERTLPHLRSNDPNGHGVIRSDQHPGAYLWQFVGCIGARCERNAQADG